jgi:hypothetical protein
MRMSRMNARLVLSDVGDRERPLPETRKLVFTENFFWVMLGCMVVVQSVPLAVAWVASTILK